MSVSLPPPAIAKPQSAALATTSAEAIDATRPQVRDALLAAPAFSALSDAERAQIAANTVKVVSYMTDPDGVLSETGQAMAAPPLPLPTAAPASAQSAPVAEAMRESATEATKRRLSGKQGFAGQDFEAGAVRQGVEQFGEMVQKVDFPKFVGGLIKNVFQAIVESSIEQMRAYGELIANVSKSVDQFMADNITEASGRDYLADKYPDVMGVNTGGGGFSDGFADADPASEEASKPVLEATGEDAAVRLAEISKQMNVNPPVTDLSDANAELRLVTAARLEMAKSRQQLLSSMVMLGINRIVVTDGSINAKVVFDMRASDKAQRTSRASMHDREAQKYTQSAKAEYGSWYTPYSASASFTGQQEHVATVGSAVDENSESKAEVKARLSGDVRVNFKSDFLPMEKMATPGMMSVIQGNSLPFDPNRKEEATS
ncbi:hypothetical protein [Erythrobacter sp. EC-HK427]|uniref:hypothetical protein n=1 Tax=Erythrobacter sp. EC-HK427 TaxID=2038396 RepID=UPI001255223A|nr:hypothetical protein [Erythrobacter sp. EC-HK427]VVT12225.1 conserved hypothetical protein [Erythrobacter sp. EC-HK427]